MWLAAKDLSKINDGEVKEYTILGCSSVGSSDGLVEYLKEVIVLAYESM
jgi:hypothetical protein